MKRLLSIVMAALLLISAMTASAGSLWYTPEDIEKLLYDTHTAHRQSHTRLEQGGTTDGTRAVFPVGDYKTILNCGDYTFTRESAPFASDIPQTRDAMSECFGVLLDAIRSMQAVLPGANLIKSSTVEPLKWVFPESAHWLSGKYLAQDFVAVPFYFEGRNQEIIDDQVYALILLWGDTYRQALIVADQAPVREFVGKIDLGDPADKFSARLTAWHTGKSLSEVMAAAGVNAETTADTSEASGALSALRELVLKSQQATEQQVQTTAQHATPTAEAIMLTEQPTVAPVTAATAVPTAVPTAAPTAAPTEPPAATPVAQVAAKPTEAPADPDAIGYVTITNSDTVGVRLYSRADSILLTRVNPGEVFPCLGVAKSGWFQIRLPDGTVGYVSPKMTRLDKK